MRGWMLGAAVAILVCAAPAIAEDKPAKLKEEILGKWSMKEENGPTIVIEFTKESKLNMAVNVNGMDIKISGTYKFLDDATVEVALEFMGEKKTEKLKIKVTKDELETTDEKGKADKFKRVK